MELPVAFCDEMKRILGDEYEDYLKSMEGTRKFGLRVNTAKISVEDFLKISPFELTPIPYVKNGFYYDGEGKKTSLRNIRIILRDYIICRTQVR